MVRTLAALLAVSLWVPAAGAPTPTRAARQDPLAEVPHENSWIEVAPVLLPRSLVPLTGETGVDGDGYPKRFVDRPALRSLLIHRRFADLTAAFERFQAEFERDHRRELWMSDALDAVGLAHPRERALIEEWIQASPRSFAPYLARAQYWFHTAFLYRGGKLARDTSSLEFAGMERAFAASARDARKALKLRPRLVEPRVLLMKAAVARGHRDEAERWLDEALRSCPRCYEPRAEWAGWALQPEWGGSVEEIEAFAASRADPRERRHRLLRGFADFARSSAAFDDQPDEALAAINRACALGDDWRFLRQRAAVKRRIGDQEGRLADLERANALHPGIPWVLFGRAWALIDSQRWEEAGRDILTLLRSEPTSDLAPRLLPPVVHSLDTLAWEAHEEGRERDAARIYDLLDALAPGDAEIAQRSAAVERPRERGPRGKFGASLGGDERPELRITVVDASGKPARGAAVVVMKEPGTFDRLERLARDPSQRAPVDGAGELRVRADVGRWTVVAFDAAGSGAVAQAVSVTTVGAHVRIALGRGVSIEGEVRDPSWRPLAGLEVQAIPVTPNDGVGSDPRALGRTTSRPDGSFAIVGLDAGEYYLLAQGSGWVSSGEVRAHGGDGGARLIVNKLRLLRGRVLVSEAGGTRPARHLAVALPFERRTFDTPDGRFEVRVDERTVPRVQVLITAEERPQVVRIFDVAKDENDAGDIVIGSGRTLRGVVVDPRGVPVENAILSLGGEDLAVTRANGAFEITVQDGPVDLLVRHADWPPARHRIGPDEQQVRIGLSGGNRLKLLVTEADGKPIRGVQLGVYGPAKSTACFTDATGRCEVSGLVDDDVNVTVNELPADPNRPHPAELRVPLTPGAENGVLFRWAKARTQVTVHVLDAQGKGSPAGALLFPGAPPLARAMDGSRPRLPNYLAPLGKAVEQLPPDRYTVVGRGIWGIKECATRTLDLGPGEKKEITLRLDDGSCR